MGDAIRSRDLITKPDRNKDSIVRRLITAAVAGCAFLITTGCSATGETPSATSTSASAPAAAAPSPTPAIALVDKATTCAAYNKTMDAVAEKVFEVGGRLNKAGIDNAAFAAAVGEMLQMWTATQAQLEQQAATAKDPEVKAAITNFAAEAKKAAAAAAGGDATKTRDALNSPALLQAQMNATELCG
jgi:hypothetical protein